MKKILVCDYKQRHSQAIIWSLKKSGYKIISFSEDNNIDFKLYGLDQIINKNYLSFKPNNLVSELNKMNCNIIIPVTINSFNYFSINKNIFISNGFKLLISDFKLWSMFHDKSKTFEFISKLNIPVPLTVNLSKYLYSNNIRDSKLNFPIVIKSTREGGGRFVRYANNFHDVDLIIEDFLSMNNNLFEEGGVIAQDFINGNGCGYFALVDKGKIISKFGHLRIRESPPSGGISTCCESFNHPKLMCYGDNIVTSSKFSGVVMIEFKYDKNSDEFYLIEINPKFWGSSLLSIISGINFPLNYVKYLENQKLGKQKFISGLRLQFVFSDLKRVVKYRVGLINFFVDLVNPKVVKDFTFFGLYNFLKFNLKK